MFKLHGKRWLCLLCGLAALGNAGCNDGDVDRLGRVWHRLESRGAAWTCDARHRLFCGWSALQTQTNSADVLRERVQMRLRMQKELAEVAIEVEVSEAKVTLKGEAPNGTLKQLAADLAQSTVGVEEVIDEMTAKE